MARLRGQLFARLALDYFDHPKIASLSAEAIVAHLEMIVYARKYLTDGNIPMRVAMRYASDVLDELASNDLERPSIIRNDDGSVTIHGYGDLQETRADVEDRRRSARERADARWNKGAPGNARSNAVSNARSNAMGNAETETETEIYRGATTESGSQSASTTSSRRRPLPHDWSPTEAHQEKSRSLRLDLAREVEKFTNHAEANGKKFVNWNSAFSNWLTKADEFRSNTGSPSGLWDKEGEF